VKYQPGAGYRRDQCVAVASDLEGVGVDPLQNPVRAGREPADDRVDLGLESFQCGIGGADLRC
jgi:hypothetical protein